MNRLLFLGLWLSFIPLEGTHISAQIACGVDTIATTQAPFLPLNRVDSAPHISRPYPQARASTIYIPVVIHLIYRTAEQNLSESIIFRQLDILNKAFSKYQSKKAIFLDGKAYPVGRPDIQFCLVNRDPEGKETNGIIRTPTEIVNIGTSFKDESRIAAQYDFFGGQDAWDTEAYLNIWICEMESLLGKSSIPGEPYFPEEEGILLNINKVAENQDGSQGLALIHEVGHYFGLYHLWGKQEGCDTDDFVNDTPIQDKPVYECTYTESCGSADMYFNYMSYTQEICWRMFTEGQVKRMRGIINKYYPSFLDYEPHCFSPIAQSSEEFNTWIENHTILLESEKKSYLNGMLRLYDIRGALLHEENLRNSKLGAINAINFPAGIYFLSFIPENTSEQYSEKIFYHPF